MTLTRQPRRSSNVETLERFTCKRSSNFQSLTNCPSLDANFAHVQSLSFQSITKCPICKSFLLITIQQYRGCVPPLLPTRHSPLSYLESTLAEMHQNKGLYLRLESTLRSYENCRVSPAILRSARSAFSMISALNPSLSSARFPTIPFVFKLLRTLLRNGEPITPLESIRCALFSMQRRVYPLALAVCQAEEAQREDRRSRRKGPGVRSQPAAGVRQAPKPCEQRCETRRVLLRHGREFQSQSLTRLTMPHDRLGPDLAFRDEKIKLGFHAYRLWSGGSNKQTSGAQVPDAGDIILTIATPAHPDPIRHFDARGVAPRIRRCLRRGGHKAP
jgi:hypothetical protein